MNPHPGPTALLGLALLALGLPLRAQAAPAPAASVDRSPVGPADGPQDVLMLRLRDGRVVWGEIIGHDPDALRLRRLETGGIVPIPWPLVDPSQERELRLRMGYVDAFEEEITIEAERLLLSNGSEVIGSIVNRTDEHLWVKRAEGTVPVAKRLVQSATSLRVPALDVYTKDELYQLKASELVDALILPGTEGARAHIELARYAERLFDFPRALEHYRIVAALDPALEVDAVRAALERTQAKALNQAQVDMLADIDLWRARRRYDRATALLDAFPRLYPQSPLMEDWNTLRRRVERYQERDLREAVVERWHHWAGQLARRAARERKGHQEVLAYLEGQMGQELLELVRTDLERIAPGIDAGSVRRLWDERESGRFHQASYGFGTWLLGEERALAGTEEEDDEDEAVQPGTQADARQRLEQRIQRYLKNQRLTRRSKSSLENYEDPELFWTRWSSASRAQWVLAYYVESSGDFVDLTPRLANCRECAGSGTREVLYTGGAMAGATASSRIVACPTCHTIGRVRRIRYR